MVQILQVASDIAEALLEFRLRLGKIVLWRILCKIAPDAAYKWNRFLSRIPPYESK